MKNFIISALSSSIGVLVGIFIYPRLKRGMQYQEEEEYDSVRLYGGPGDGELIDLYQHVPLISPHDRVFYTGSWNEEVHQYVSEGNWDEDGAIRMVYRTKIDAGESIYPSFDEEDDDEPWSGEDECPF